MRVIKIALFFTVFFIGQNQFAYAVTLNDDAAGALDDAKTSNANADYYRSIALDDTGKTTAEDTKVNGVPLLIQQAQIYRNKLSQPRQTLENFNDAQAEYIRMGNQETNTNRAGINGECYQMVGTSLQTGPCNLGSSGAGGSTRVSREKSGVYDDTYRASTKPISPEPFRNDGNNPQNRPRFDTKAP